MSPQQPLNLRTHERDYNRYAVPCPIPKQHTTQAAATHCAGKAVYDGTGDDAGFVAVDEQGRELPDSAALVWQCAGLGRTAVGGGRGASGENGREVCAGGG